MEAFERALETATNKESRGNRVAHGLIAAAIDKSGNINDVQNCARKYLLTDNVQVNTSTRGLLVPYHCSPMPHQFPSIMLSQWHLARN